MKFTRRSYRNLIQFGYRSSVANVLFPAALKVRQTLDSDMPIIAPATGSMVFRLPTDPSIINIRASYLDETTAMVDYLVNQRFVSRISILYQNDTFGQAGTRIPKSCHQMACETLFNLCSLRLKLTRINQNYIK